MAALAAASSLLCVLLPAQDAGSPDARERRRAARALEKQGSSAIPQLEKLLSDADLEVRIEAVKALVGIGTQHSLDPLIAASRDRDPEIQIRASDGLVNFYLPGFARDGLSASLRRTGNRIMSRWTDTNDQVIEPWVEARPEACEALGRLASGGASMEARANAARAAGVLRCGAAAENLLEAARSKDSRVIYEALVAFQKIRDRSVGPKLEFLLRDLDERVQTTALETMGLLYNLDSLPALRSVLARTGSRNVRRAALTAIAMLPDPANRQVLLPYLRDRDAESRAAAAEGLGRLKHPEDIPELRERFDQENNNLARLSAAFALVLGGNHELSEFSPLQYMVNTLNSATRAPAARALLIEAARDPGVRAALHQSLVRGGRDEKAGLMQVLAASGDSESARLIEPLTRDPDLHVAQEAIRSLRALRMRLP